MAEPLLAGAYYLLLLLGGVSLGKIVLCLAAPGFGREDEKSTGLAALLGVGVVAVALAIDLLASGWSAVSTATGILSHAILAASALGVLAAKTVFSQSIKAIEPQTLSSAIEEAERQEKLEEKPRQVGEKKTEEKPASPPSYDEHPPPSISEVIKLGGEKPVEKKEEKKREENELKEIGWSG